MEGGGLRGMFTCGVVDVFLEQGLRFDGAAGISAGAVFGCNFKSRQAGRAIRYNKQYCGDPRYFGFRSLFKTGDLFNVEFCYHTLPDELDLFDREAFAADPTEFYVGTTDIVTGKPVYHKCVDGGENDFAWMRASASLPLVSRIVEVDGYKLLDGGIVDSVPYEYMESLGFNRNVIITTQPFGYRKKKSDLLPWIKLKLRKYPAMVKAVKDRPVMYNAQMEGIDLREREGSSIVIRPPHPLDIGHTERDPRVLDRVYRDGRAAAEKRVEEIKNFLRDE